MAALLIGFGNQGRGDDGLGPLFAERIERAAPAGLDIDIDYQLTVDHALAASEADLVIFADAEIGAAGSFSFAPVAAEGATGMGSHELSPQAVLTLAKTLYGKTPPAFLLGIAGWDYGEVKEGLSERGGGPSRRGRGVLSRLVCKDCGRKRPRQRGRPSSGTVDRCMSSRSAKACSTSSSPKPRRPSSRR